MRITWRSWSGAGRYAGRNAGPAHERAAEASTNLNTGTAKGVFSGRSLCIRPKSHKAQCPFILTNKIRRVVSEFAVGEMIVPASSRQNNSWADGNQNKFTKHH